ncbi:MAG: hypothetical protein A2171_02740 [Candidatus Levybacteria bacterium RBG_13_35_9]|nr:MAG: hypothetical protein A2171_02740 [Candidatus Levybacteria bacterium RBG_13_35_9]
MRYRIILIAILILIFSAFVYYFKFTILNSNEFRKSVSNLNPTKNTDQAVNNNLNSAEAITVIAQNLDTPWAIAFLPDGDFLVTERKGTVQLVNKKGNIKEAGSLPSVKEIGEGGLLGIAAHPQFNTNNFVYFYYTFSETGGNTLNRVVRMTLRQVQGKLVLNDEEIILDRIPGAANHNGGRIKFGPDGLLYIGTGDAQNPSQAQNTNTLGGKILRITDEGKPAVGNKFNNPVYSYGHRNVQGLSWDKNGSLWATEHGRSGIQSGLDEVNLIESGGNFGWPEIQGDEGRAGMISPKKHSGSDTWAPSGAAFVENSLFFSGLRGQALYEAVIEGDQVTEVKEHFKGQFGRIREVILGPDGFLYITTSNKDGRGNPDSTDDKVLKINPEKL